MIDLGHRGCRVDVWLWSARFFKTRRLAKEAIEGGKVHCAGQRVKAGKDVYPGLILQISQGCDERDISVVNLAWQRGSAAVASMLYEETAESLERTAKRKLERQSQPYSEHKPDKRERRQIIQFKLQ